VADDPASPGWLPPRAPGGRPPPRFDGAPAPEPPQPPEPPPEGLPGGDPEPAPQRARDASRPTFAATGRRQADGLAVGALALGIVGLLLLLLTAGLGFALTLPCSLTACWLGSRARTRIELGQARGGAGQARAGYLLGVAGVVLGVVAAVGWIVAMALGVDPQELQRNLERHADPHAREALLRAARALIAR
jgi:hypothetical protein